MKMKKIISGLTALLTVSALSLTAAANVRIEPKYPMHGNKCGMVTVVPDVERDIHVVIVQNTIDGDYKYYDEIIPADAQDRVSEFALEGKDDVMYTITIGVPKYKGTQQYEEYTDKFGVPDTDEMTDSDIAGYNFTFNVGKNEAEEVASQITRKGEADIEKIVQTETALLFPVLEAIKGDVNNDGKVNVRDAAAIASGIVKGIELPPYGDFNDDGKVNIRDAAAIASSITKK